MVELQDLRRYQERLIDSAEEAIRLVQKAKKEDNTSYYAEIDAAFESYVSVAAADVDALSFVALKDRALNLNKVIDATRAEIQHGGLPPFDMRQEEALSTFFDLHRMFIDELKDAKDAIVRPERIAQVMGYVDAEIKRDANSDQTSPSRNSQAAPRQKQQQTSQRRKYRASSGRKRSQFWANVPVLIHTYAPNIIVVCIASAFMGFCVTQASQNLGVISVAWGAAALAVLESIKRAEAFKAITGPMAYLMDATAEATTARAKSRSSKSSVALDEQASQKKQK